ncbi:MAG: metallophosphoesterase family protein [Candidatus Methanoplasma sp.]|jgi:Icc-related predicted phosphoesterase|nr:metallophosphoesterase family protein [Candidatus Methanoplasma sp.]
MRVLIVSDIHQKASAAEWINGVIAEEEPDEVFVLGDVTDLGTGEDAARILGSIRRRVYAIPGNCDPLDFPEKIGGAAISAHARSYDVGGFHVAFLGGSNRTIFGTPFEMDEEDISDALEPISAEGMVLATHVPAFGALDHIPGGISVGSHAVRGIVDRFRPIAALSGHVHEDRGIVREGGTLYVNPGPARDGCCAIVDLREGRADAELIGPERTSLLTGSKK